MTANGKPKRDERIRELHERGLSLRAIGRRVGLRRQQVHRILAAMATGEPGEVVAVLAADEELHAAHITVDMIAADPDIWRRLSCLERYAHIEGGWWVPPHDPDHQMCCVAHGIDPDWFDPEKRAMRAPQSREWVRGGVIPSGDDLDECDDDWDD